MLSKRTCADCGKKVEKETHLHKLNDKLYCLSCWVMRLRKAAMAE